MSSEASGHMPDGYYVIAKKSGRKVLYSPHKIPISDTQIGGYVEGTKPRPVCSWRTPIGNKKLHEIARLDRDVREKRVGASIALMALREVFRP